MKCLTEKINSAPLISSSFTYTAVEKSVWSSSAWQRSGTLHKVSLHLSLLLSRISLIFFSTICPYLECQRSSSPFFFFFFFFQYLLTIVRSHHSHRLWTQTVEKCPFSSSTLGPSDCKVVVFFLLLRNGWWKERRRLSCTCKILILNIRTACWWWIIHHCDAQTRSSILHELSCLLSMASISLITFTAVIHQTSDTMARPDRRGSEWGHIPFLQIALTPHSLLKTCKMFDKVGVRNYILFIVKLNKRCCRDREDNPLPQTHRDVCAVWNSDLLNWREGIDINPLYFVDTIFDWALAIEFLDGCPLFYKTPVSYLPLICEDRSMQTLELPIHTMSSVCPPSWCNLTLKSEPPKINKWNPNQKCCSPLDECQRRKDDPSWFDFVSKPHDAFGQLKFQQVIRW